MFGCQAPAEVAAKPGASDSAPPAEPTEPAIQPAPKDGGLQWAANVTEGRKLARAENKPLMIKFTADWCAPCRFMEDDAWIDSAVRATLKDVVLTRIYDTEPDAPKLGREYKVTLFPTMVFLDDDGSLIGKVEGYRNAPEFVSMTKAVLAKRR